MKDMINEEQVVMPTTVQLEEELNRIKYKYKYRKLLKSTVYMLIIVVAMSVLVSTLIFPVLRIYGGSMSPTLISDDIVLCIKKSNFESGDVIAFYYNNHILVKRVVATSSDWVNIDSEGNVFVNDKLLEEPYVLERYYGEVDIEFPYQVPENAYFVLGDERILSIDSRNSLIGAVSEGKIIGKVILRVWPLNRLSIIN